MQKHETGTTLISDLAGLTKWLNDHAPAYEAASLAEAIKQYSAGRMPVFPMQCRADIGNHLALDADGKGNVAPRASTFPTYSALKFGGITRMNLEIAL